jgi:hypothetical protein
MHGVPEEEIGLLIFDIGGESMLVHQFNKPTNQKKKAKIAPKPPLFQQDTCLCCEYYGRRHDTGLDKHHLYGAANRPLSEREGLYCKLCNEFQPNNCHWNVTNEKDKQFITWLKQEGQRRHEEAYGKGKFFEIFRRLYI